MTGIAIDVSAFEKANGCEPRGKRAWQWEIGVEVFDFNGKFYEGRRAASERAATLGVSRIALLCAKGAAPTLPAKPEPKPAEPAKPVVANVSNDETLNAIYAARVAESATETPASAPQLETDFRMVDLWVDDARVGCGFRRFIVLETGPKTVRLFYIPLLTAIVVDRKYFDKKARHAKNAFRKVAGEFIRRKIEQFEKINDAAQKEIAQVRSQWVDHALQLCA